MWYNILPSFAIVTAVMGVPALVIAGTHKLIFGNMYQRQLEGPLQRHMHKRDGRLSGNPYVTLGLENIPDEEPSEE